MRSVLASLFALLGLLLVTDMAAAAERRVALVVGNSSYPGAPLANPKNDANDVADTLTHLGFEVIRHIDAGRNDINDALEEFQRKASNADAALFYYAGHAMQYDGQNYLLPVDAVLRDRYSVPQLTSLSRIKDALASCEECVKIMILDACRNNPLADQFLKEQGVKNRSLSNPARGLARLSEKPDGMIVVFATQAGDVAADGDGRNSPFTQALLTELKKPELGLSELFNDVALDVKTATGKTQVPEISYSAVRTLNEFYLNQSEGDNTAFEKLDFSDLQALRHFIEKYPESSKRRVVESLVVVMERQARDRAEEARQEAERDRLQAEAKQNAEADRQRQESNAEAQRKVDAERARLAAEAEAKRLVEAKKAETDRLRQEADAEAQRKRDAERARLAAEDDAKRQVEAKKAEADRLKQEADAEAQRKRDAERARLAAEDDAKRQVEAKKAEADRLKQEADAEAQREVDAERARLAAEDDAKRQVEAKKAEADRQRQAADAEAQRKLDLERARLAAEDAKRQVEAKKVEADRLKQEAEAQRKLDLERVRLAAEAELKRQAEAKQKAEIGRLKQEADADAQRELDLQHARLAAEAATQRTADAAQGQGSTDAAQPKVGPASGGQQTAVRQGADAASTPSADDVSRHQDLQKGPLATTCTIERAQFVVLKGRGVSGLKALTAFKEHLVCTDMVHEVQAAVEATSIKAAAQRQSALPHRTYAVDPAAQRPIASPTYARVQPSPIVPSRGGSHNEAEVRQARSNRERNRSDDPRPATRLPPALAVSASAPTVDFRGGGF